jgi:hypothetical protein
MSDGLKPSVNTIETVKADMNDKSYTVNFEAKIGNFLLKVSKACRSDEMSTKYTLNSPIVVPFMETVLGSALDTFVQKDFIVRPLPLPLPLPLCGSYWGW